MSSGRNQDRENYVQLKRIIHVYQIDQLKNANLVNLILLRHLIAENVYLQTFFVFTLVVLTQFYACFDHYNGFNIQEMRCTEHLHNSAIMLIFLTLGVSLHLYFFSRCLNKDQTFIFNYKQCVIIMLTMGIISLIIPIMYILLCCGIGHSIINHISGLIEILPLTSFILGHIRLLVY